MIEVHPHLFVGSGTDLVDVETETGDLKEGWFVISAAKYPWHRDALGYKTAAAPKDDPEYLVAQRGRRLIFNLIDAPGPAYIPDKLMNTALDALDLTVPVGVDTLVHCNKGESRAPTIAMLWLHRIGELPDDYDLALERFHQLYPSFSPGKGMAEYAKAHWEAK